MVKEIEVFNLWKKIVYNVWKLVELGVLFWDIIICELVFDCYVDLGYKMVLINFCGEILLCFYDFC